MQDEWGTNLIHNPDGDIHYLLLSSYQFNFLEWAMDLVTAEQMH